MPLWKEGKLKMLFLILGSTWLARTLCSQSCHQATRSSWTSCCWPRPTTPSMTTAALASGGPCWLGGRPCLLMDTGSLWYLLLFCCLLMVSIMLLVWTSFLQRQAAPNPCSNQKTTSEGLDQSWCFLDTTATAKAGPSASMRICANAKGTWLTSKPQTFMLSTVGWHLCPEYKNTFQLHLSATSTFASWLISRGFCIFNSGLTSLSKIQEYIPPKFNCPLLLSL